MSQELSKLLVDIIGVVLLVCIPMVMRYVRDAIAGYTALSKNDSAQAVFNEIADVVETAVGVVNQTYVDAIKTSKEPFTKEEQERALRQAYSTATRLLSQTAKDYIEKNCGGIYEYLTAHIEAEVRKQKIPSTPAEPDQKTEQKAE